MAKIYSLKNTYKAGAVAASVIVPTVYMTKFHVDMYPKHDKVGRSKIFNKMMGFFGGAAVGCLWIHKSLKYPLKNNKLKRAAILAISACLPYAGVKISKAINNELYPKKNTNAQTQKSHKEVFKPFMA